MYNLFEDIPQEYNRRYIYWPMLANEATGFSKMWETHERYLERGLDDGSFNKGDWRGETQVIHVVFSNQSIKGDKKSWTIYSMSAYRTGSFIIINDFYEIDVTSQFPTTKTIIDLFHANSYLGSLDPDTIYWFGKVITHRTLLEKITKLLTKQDKNLRPLSDFNLWY